MEKQVNKTTVQKILIGLGVSPSIGGYDCLTSAIMIKFACRQMRMGMLYAEVGKINGISATAAERCMRFAVSRLYNINRLSGINELYNAKVISYVPSLSEFIMYIVEYLCLYFDERESQQI